MGCRHCSLTPRKKTGLSLFADPNSDAIALTGLVIVIKSGGNGNVIASGQYGGYHLGGGDALDYENCTIKDANGTWSPSFRYNSMDAGATGLTQTAFTSTQNADGFDSIGMGGATTTTGAYAFLNGDSPTYCPLSPKTFFTLSALAFDPRWSSLSTYYNWSGYVAELVAYTRPISVGELRSASLYMDQKYGITR